MLETSGLATENALKNHCYRQTVSARSKIQFNHCVVPSLHNPAPVKSTPAEATASKKRRFATICIKSSALREASPREERQWH